MSKEPNGVLVMATCKCRENTKNLVMTREYFTDIINMKIIQGEKQERERIIEIIERLPFIWGGTTQMIRTSRDDVIALIQGQDND